MNKYYTEKTFAAAIYSSLLGSCKCIGSGARNLNFNTFFN